MTTQRTSTSLAAQQRAEETRLIVYYLVEISALVGLFFFDRPWSVVIAGWFTASVLLIFHSKDRIKRIKQARVIEAKVLAGVESTLDLVHAVRFRKRSQFRKPN